MEKDNHLALSRDVYSKVALLKSWKMKELLHFIVELIRCKAVNYF